MLKLFKNGGFTLVEVLIMLTVISILASLSFLGYSAYIQNANKSAISTAANAYQSSLKAYAFEKETFPKEPGCLPNGSKCCFSFVSFLPWVGCGTDAESGMGSSTTGVDVSKYISNQAPKLPVFKGFTNCIAGWQTGPCKATASIPIVGMFYFPKNSSSTIYPSTDPNAKGFLIYYVDLTYDCNSKDVMTLSGGNLSFNSSAQFTREQTTPPAYRECIIGVRPN